MRLLILTGNDQQLRGSTPLWAQRQTLTAWVKVGCLIVLIRGTAGLMLCRNLQNKKENMDMKAMMRIAFGIAMLALVAVIVVMVVRTWWAQGGQNIGQLVAALVFYGAGGFAIWYTGDSALRKEK